jgi:hypothetical protein
MLREHVILPYDFIGKEIIPRNSGNLILSYKSRNSGLINEGSNSTCSQGL